MHIEKAVVSYNSFFYLKGKLRLGLWYTSPKKRYLDEVTWSHKKLTWQLNENPDSIGQHKSGTSGLLRRTLAPEG